MDFGVTGTRNGMTDEQMASVRDVLLYLDVVGFRTMHNGDCVGVDEQMYWLWKKHGAIVHGHPPTDNRYRANLRFDRCENAKPYLDRNRDIVDRSRILIVCPGQMTEQVRSGTWATYRYAKATDKRRIIIYSDGSVKKE